MPGEYQYDEKELLPRIAGGDEGAFRILFEEYAPKVMHIANLFTDSEAIAEDIVQDVFMKLWLKRVSLPEILDFNNWIFIVARNLSINALKKIAKAGIRYESLPDHLPHTDAYASTDLDAKDLEKHIREAMQLLTEQQKKVFELSKMKGLNREEISETLGLSPNTVKMHLVRSTRLVRAYLLAKGDRLISLIIFLISYF